MMTSGVQFKAAGLSVSGLLKAITSFAVLHALISGALISGALAQEGKTIRIGDINSYAKIKAFTEPYRQGMELALEEVNEAGGVLDGQKLEVVFRDDKGDPGEAVRIADELTAGGDVALITGSFYSHVGLALTSWAKARQQLYLAAEPLADSLVWKNGNRYTFRLRPSTYMQAAMLAEIAAQSGKTKWATLAPNYAYGQEAVANFKQLLQAQNPDASFVAEQWPALGRINAAAEVLAIQASGAEAIFNVTFGADLIKFVREGSDRGFFGDKFIVSLLSGEPEYIDPLKDEAPEGWKVTGYPWYAINTPEHDAFLTAYQNAYGDSPRAGSLVGYNTLLAVAAAINRAGSSETEMLVDAFKGLEFDSPVGTIYFRPQDHQSTMGAFVGTLKVEDGMPRMVDWTYQDGADYLPDDETVKNLRPPE